VDAEIGMVVARGGDSSFRTQRADLKMDVLRGALNELTLIFRAMYLCGQPVMMMHPGRNECRLGTRSGDMCGGLAIKVCTAPTRRFAGQSGVERGAEDSPSPCGTRGCRLNRLRRHPSTGFLEHEKSLEYFREAHTA
jgi:hypothetical protein